MKWNENNLTGWIIWMESNKVDNGWTHDGMYAELDMSQMTDIFAPLSTAFD